MTQIDKAFILAAGLGTRMRPFTDQIPKPLVEIQGVSLLGRTLNHLQQAGVKDVVINTHHLAQQIPDHLAGRSAPRLSFSHEPQLLDTAGGIQKMLQHFGDDPFYVLSGDGLWTDNPDAPALRSLNAAWDPTTMDILILLQPVSTMKLTPGVGDYIIEKDGRARRSLDKKGTHMFTSMRINHPRIFEDLTPGPSSYLPLLDAAEKAGRLFAIEHQGQWHHISTPQDVAVVDAAFSKDKGAA